MLEPPTSSAGQVKTHGIEAPRLWRQIRRLMTIMATQCQSAAITRLWGHMARTAEAEIDAGAAYIYHRTGENIWDNGVKIMATDPDPEDRFSKVSISGDYAIVGAYGEDSGGRQRGRAYIYRRTGENSWDAGRKIMAIDSQQDDYFGISTAVSGDYAIAGAFGGQNKGRTGAAYIFNKEKIRFFYVKVNQEGNSKLSLREPGR